MAMQTGLIIVSNRLPVSAKKKDGVLELVPSDGGLATGLGSYALDKKNKWIGWPGIPSEDLTEADKREIEKKLLKYNCYPVFLTQKQLSLYYNGYSNSILWPLFHEATVSEESKKAERTYWRAYEEVNEAFADAVLKLSKEGGDVWVHDYQLLLLPSLIRAQRPNDKIGFFSHIPFPEPKRFNTLKHAKELITGILGADLVGFHTDSYVQHFLETISKHDYGILSGQEIILPGRIVKITHFPMGIDYSKFAKAARQRNVHKELAKLRAKYYGKKLILTVDRLDPSKGLVERTIAYQTFLRENPKLHRKVTLFMLAIPTRAEIKEYQELKIKLEKLIREVNHEFGTKRWKPIEYKYSTMPFEQLTAYYQRADVAFIAPIRDGMNLVAKEYLASKPRKNGVLILSQTAGAAEQLKDAIMVDHTEPASLVRGLNRAFTMPTTELRSRITRMQTLVEKTNVQSWAGNFMTSLKKASVKPSYARALSPTRQQRIFTEFSNASKRLFLLDYDGVLVSFHADPSKSTPSTELKRILKTLADDPKTTVIIISGRKREDLTAWLGELPIGMIAEHGAFVRAPGKKRWESEIQASADEWQSAILPILEKHAAKVPGAFVEKKSSALVWHYRNAKPYYAQKYLVSLKRSLKKYAAAFDLEVRQGNMIVEVRAPGVNKGTAAMPWLQDNPDFIITMGDDYTDEDMFATMPQDAFTVKVGRGKTIARYRAKDVRQVHHILRRLSKLI